MTNVGADLFRQEALKEQRVRLEGEVLLNRGSNALSAAVLLVCAAVALGAWLVGGRYTRTESTKGILVTDADAAKVIALRPGVIVRLSATEGQVVSRGQPLATVQVEQQFAEGVRATEQQLLALLAQRRSASRQLGALRERGRSERAGLNASVVGAFRQRSDVERQLELQQRLVDSLRRTLESYRPIAAKGFVSQNDLNRKEQELLTAEQGLGGLHQQLAVLEAEARKAVAELGRSSADERVQTAAADSSVEALRLQEAQVRSERSYVVTAPVSGVVTALQTGLGRTVDPALPLLSIVPQHARVHAELYAASRAIGFVRTGQEVRLLYDAFPYERFGSFSGRITSVSRVAIDPRQVDAPLQLQEPVYRIAVMPERQVLNGFGERVRLQPGMTLSANVVLERRSFLDWLLEPLRAVSRRDRS